MGIIVAGIPRSGTTLLFRTVAGMHDSPYTPIDCFGMSKINVKGGPRVVKAIRFRPDIKGDHKVLFIFGSVIHSIISTRLNRWDRRHFYNCGFKKRVDRDRMNIWKKDFLGYETLFDTWHSQTTFPSMFIRYEKLYDHTKEIEKFTGRILDFPVKKVRKTKLEGREAVIKQIKKTYGSLIEKLDSLPDVSYINT